MKATIEANLNERAIEKITAPKKPELVLFILNSLNVLGNGLLTGVIVTLSVPVLYKFV